MEGLLGSHNTVLTIAAQLLGAVGPITEIVAAFKSGVDVSGWTLPVVAAGYIEDFGAACASRKMRDHERILGEVISSINIAASCAPSFQHLSALIRK